MARLRRLDWALDLPINAFYATPLVALVPILVLWFGIYLKAKVIVVFLFAVFPIIINTYQGVRECDQNMLEVAQSFRSTEWAIWRDVLLPFALPYIAAGIRLAIGRGLVGMIIAEFYTTITGLGFMVTKYANVFEMDKTFVPVIVLMILGVTLTAVLKRLERRIAPWRRRKRERLAGRRLFKDLHDVAVAALARVHQRRHAVPVGDIRIRSVSHQQLHDLGMGASASAEDHRLEQRRPAELVDVVLLDSSLRAES